MQISTQTYNYKLIKHFKRYVLTVLMTMSFKVFFKQQYKFLSACQPATKRFQSGKINKLKILIHVILGLIEKRSLFPEKYWFVAAICLIWKLKEYSNDYRSNAPTICTFLKYQIFPVKKYS